MKIKIKCLYCNEEFENYLSNNRKYCSVKCYTESSRAIYKCLECAKEVKVAKTRLHMYKFCSEKCSKNFYRDKIVCLNCGKEFSLLKWEIKEIQTKFCSKECRIDYYKKEINKKDIICPICNKKFKVWKSSKVKTCSIKCGSLFKTGQKRSKETKLRMSLIAKGKPKTLEHIKNILKSVCASPNKFEQKCFEYLNKIYPNEFKYVGDGSVLVNGKSPDFISEKLKTIVLAHGWYYHLKIKNLEITEENKRSVEKIDSLPFLQAGYKVIFIWEDELPSSLTKKKI